MKIEKEVIQSFVDYIFESAKKENIKTPAELIGFVTTYFAREILILQSRVKELEAIK